MALLGKWTGFGHEESFVYARSMQENDFAVSYVGLSFLHKRHNVFFKQPLIIAAHLTANTAHNLFGLI
jgi:hypothetical protein